MTPPATPCRWSFVMRYRHQTGLPDVSVHVTASEAWTEAGKLKAVYSAERITVMQDGFEQEVSQ